MTIKKDGDILYATEFNDKADKSYVDTEAAKKQDTLVSGTNIKTINNQSILGSGNITIEAGSSVTVDSTLSATSTNPVQNKVINSALNGKANTSHTHSTNQVGYGSVHESATMDPTFRPLVGSSASNRLFGIPNEAITIEHSKDAGATWTTDTSIDNYELFSYIGKHLYIGGSGAVADNSVNNMTRITIDISKADERYVTINTIYHWMSTQGNTIYYTLEGATNGSPDTFTVLSSNNQLAGQSGANVTYFASKNLGGTASNNLKKLRFTYKVTAIGTSTAPVINKIYAFGMNYYGGISSDTFVESVISQNTPYKIYYKPNKESFVRFWTDKVSLYYNNKDNMIATKDYADTKLSADTDNYSIAWDSTNEAIKITFK